MARSNRRRKLNISLKVGFYITLFSFLVVGCNQSQENASGFQKIENNDKGISIYGQTQGTTYAVLCNDRIIVTKAEVDELLKGFDAALSTYIPHSIISKFNNAPTGSFLYTDSLGYFNNCMEISQSVFQSTDGAFDPSVFSLLEIWGFLKDVNHIPDTLMVLRTLRNTGFRENYHYKFFPNSVDSLPSKITKRTADFKLVFNAIAQGQAVDVVSKFLESKGAKNYFVEIGGEVRVKGVNDQGNIWSIGIDKPIENSTVSNRELIHVIELENKAVATSGNYRQFYERNGVKYAHTLNPKTGFPVTHQLLSATVVAKSCALADGYATAFMVMGTEKAIEFIEANEALELDLFLVYNTEKGTLETFATDGFSKLIK